MDDGKVSITKLNPIRTLNGAGPGRPRGMKNKTTKMLKDALLAAAAKAGGKAGMIGYLAEQAEKNPGPFMSLLGKVLPLQVANADGEDKFVIEIIKFADSK